MRNNSEKKTSSQDVLPAVAGCLARHDKEHFTGAPGVIQQMFEDLMCTPYGDSREYRERIIITLRTIRDFGQALQPFPEDVIYQAIQNY